jgi:hypothetical protein
MAVISRGYRTRTNGNPSSTAYWTEAIPIGPCTATTMDVGGRSLRYWRKTMIKVAMTPVIKAPTTQRPERTNQESSDSGRVSRRARRVRILACSKPNGFIAGKPRQDRQRASSPPPFRPNDSTSERLEGKLAKSVASAFSVYSIPNCRARPARTGAACAWSLQGWATGLFRVAQRVGDTQDRERVGGASACSRGPLRRCTDALYMADVNVTDLRQNLPAYLERAPGRANPRDSRRALRALP